MLFAAGFGFLCGVVLIVIYALQCVDKEKRLARGLPEKKYHNAVDWDVTNVYDWSRK